MIKVSLIAHTPDPERTVAASARLCYSKLGPEELLTKISEKKIKRLITELRSMGHTSTFEHASFTFAIEGVSRVLTHQLVRHRIASYTQRSQRYVTEKEFEYIVPNAIAENEEALRIYEEQMQSAHNAYKELMKHVHKEDARYVLPNATETKIVVTMNARTLLHFFSKRCCIRAQAEIRELADKMLELVKEVAPNIFGIAGPTCVTEEVCYEGKMTCGRAKVVK